MSNFRFRRLEQFRTGGSGDRMQLSLPLPRSPKGRFQRYCPNEKCVPRRFQLADAPAEQTVADENRRLVRRLPKTPGTTCPYCGADDGDQDFTAPEDIANAKELVKWAASEDVGEWAENLARDFNRQTPSGGLISIKMDVKRSRKAKPYPWREDLLRGLTCDVCGRGYGVYAIALFCPDCGSRNIHVHFAREVAIVERQIELSQGAADGGDEELGFRLLGNAHEDVLTALETYLRTIFLFLAHRRLNHEDAIKAEKEARRGNPFQSVERAENLFLEIGASPFAVLSEEDQEFLVMHINKRHVIGHNLGLVDEKYLESANQGTEGESIRLLGDDVRRFAKLAFHVVVVGLEETASEFLPNNASAPSD